MPKAPSPASSRACLSRKRKLLYTALTFTVFLLLCELGLRLRAWIKYGSVNPNITNDVLLFDTELGLHIPRPGYSAQGSTRNLTINSLGFRGEEITAKKPSNTIRIVCLGASTTFCGEVNDEEAWPYRLQEKLRRWAAIRRAAPARTVRRRSTPAESSPSPTPPAAPAAALRSAGSPNGSGP